MLRPRFSVIIVAFLVAGWGLGGLVTKARAVPSFARQTGMSCTMCHTVWPQLTPFGRTFKLNGYTMSKTGKKYQFPPPVAGMFEGSFTHTDKAQPPGAAPNNSQANDNVNLPQQASVFYAGKIYDKLGAFMQLTYDGVGNTFFIDNTDIRFADTTKIADKLLVYGISFNNNPTVQDVYNTTPAWGFPFASSSVAPGPAAGAVIDGALASQVSGLGAYLYWNNLIYGEVNFYRTAANSYSQPLSAGTVITSLVDGIAPYWRLFVQHQWGKHSLEVGHYGMVTHIFPGGQTRGSTDEFIDIAFDAQYQYISRRHKFAILGTWIHEIQNWNASYALGDTANRHDTLETIRVNCNYSYWSDYGTFGGTVAFFNIFGNRDTGLYAPDPLDGSKSGLPNTNGVIIQGEYLPPIWGRRSKIVVQYTLYSNFNGAGTDYDGSARNASDNNTLYLLAWLMF
jgi:hypothetical protein